LFLQGYSVEPVSPGVFRVLRPISRGGGCYRVDALEDTCQCPSRIRCRHLRGLRSLLFAVAALMEDTGELDAAALLLDAWAETICLRKSLYPERRAA
jgi:hypothetical protein